MCANFPFASHPHTALSISMSRFFRYGCLRRSLRCDWISLATECTLQLFLLFCFILWFVPFILLNSIKTMSERPYRSSLWPAAHGDGRRRWLRCAGRRHQIKSNAIFHIFGYDRMESTTHINRFICCLRSMRLECAFKAMRANKLTCHRRTMFRFRFDEHMWPIPSCVCVCACGSLEFFFSSPFLPSHRIYVQRAATT